MVWVLNDNTDKALSLLRAYHDRFEAANNDLCDVDTMFDIEFDELATLSKVSAMAQTKMEQAMKEADWAVKEAAVAQNDPSWSHAEWLPITGYVRLLIMPRAT